MKKTLCVREKEGKRERRREGKSEKRERRE
jgi:hypothetical protein